METPLDSVAIQREVRIDLDWIPPAGLEEGDLVSED